MYNKALRRFVWGFAFLSFLLKHKGACFKIFTHLTKTERLLLYRLARSLNKQSVIVEIGSYLGASSSFLACAAKERNHSVYCVDTWENEGMSEGGRDTFEEFSRNLKLFKDFITPLRGRSADVAKTFDKEIDLIFIDGDHSYEGVKTDVEAWLPKMKKGGILIFHDIGWAEGVKRVVSEYIKPRQIEEHVIDNTYWARV